MQTEQGSDNVLEKFVLILCEIPGELSGDSHLVSVGSAFHTWSENCKCVVRKLSIHLVGISVGMSELRAVITGG